MHDARNNGGVKKLLRHSQKTDGYGLSQTKGDFVMYQANVNVVVDVKQSLSREQSSFLAGELGEIPGVHRAQVSEHAPRLVLVDYDPARINAKHILGSFVRHGYDARLIGM